MIRILVTLPLAVALTACVGRVSDCTHLAGPGWQKLPGPPADSRELLTRANLAGDSDLVWFAQGPNQVLLCDHSNSLVNPGCGGSTAYPFEKVDGKWIARGVLLDICKDPNAN